MGCELTTILGFSNVQFVPVDTIICFRASCPLVIAIIEYFYLDRELPSMRSWLSLLGESLSSHHQPHF